MSSTRPVLLYDGHCRPCRFTARAVIRLDRRHELAVLPLQDPAADPLLTVLPERERLASWRLARPDGTLAGYGSGIPELLATMRLTRPLARALHIVPAGALDAAYRLVAGSRGRLGRIVPDGPAPRRFP
jgi:predicted DCC family thiol-disulfide oxidoreductase YuxK